jgi:luciferase family oxidoreductase group 1
VTDAAGPRLSVLDLAPVSSGSSSAQALRNSTELARVTERLGFHRYWVAEHHGMPGIASSSPAVLIAHLAAATERMRIGSGGVMLPNHAPLVVAEQFGMLEALHPGRIDLGIGRAPGTDPLTARALRRTEAGLGAEDFPQELLALTAFFAAEPAARGALVAVPAAGNAPEVWLLGSSGYSAQLAGLLGLPFAFAHHFSPDNTLPALAMYRSAFRPSTVLSEPYAMVCVSAIAAPSTQEARLLAEPGGLAFLRLRNGRPGLLPSAEETAAHPYSDAERAFVDDRLSTAVLGDPDTALAGLVDLAAVTQADELMVTTMVHQHADRIHSYELLAGQALADSDGVLRLPAVAALAG